MGKTTITLLTDMAINPAGVAAYCDSVMLTRNPNSPVWKAPKASGDPGSAGLVCFKNIPTYLRVAYLNKDSKLHSITTVNGYAIDLQGVTAVNQYMGKQFSKKARGNILRGVRRLEDAFSIRYERYYGAIDKQQCQELLAMLKDMIISRFEERNETSHTLREWEGIRTTLYTLILEKKASLFVIYQEDRPIAISVAYHYGSLFFYFIAAFDITYSKFSMGNIMLFKQLEWSIANGYDFFEMAWGDLDYKRRWSNRVQPLENIYILPKKAVGTYIGLLYEMNKSRLITFLINRKVNVYYRQLKNKILGKESSFVPIVYHLIDTDQLPKDAITGRIDVDLPEFSHLKTILNDFLYTTQEPYENTLIVKYGSDYYIQGKNSTKQIFLEQF